MLLTVIGAFYNLSSFPKIFTWLTCLGKVFYKFFYASKVFSPLLNLCPLLIFGPVSVSLLCCSGRGWAPN